jgi:predicted O-linked N-acetylglucosamine transferase (SPINDLY family)
MNIDETLKRAMSLQQNGWINEAAQLYQAILARRPKEVNALHLLGCCYLQANKPDAALPLFDAMLRIAPGFAMGHSNRAVALRRLKRYEDALASADQALAIQPEMFDAHCNRCAILNDLNRSAEALTEGDRGVALRPGDPVAHNNRGEALRRLKRWDEALACYETAVTINPNFEEALFNRGVALIELGRFEEALTSIEKALALRPNSAESHFLRGQVLVQLKRRDEAISGFEAAIANQPDMTKAHSSRGAILFELGVFSEALVSCNRAIALNPGQVDVHGNRANILSALGRHEDALSSYNKVIELDMNCAEAYANRGICLDHLKRYKEGVADLQKAFDLNPGIPWVRGNWLHSLMHCCVWKDFDKNCQDVLQSVERDQPVASPFTLLATSANPVQLQQSARIVSRERYPLTEQQLCGGERYNHDRLRIGYFSADFHDHATAHLMAELFECHDRERFEIIAFSFGPSTQDAWRERLIGAFERFLDVRGASDGQIARLARELELDIAVDLKGYTQDLRTGIFAFRPAPVQVNFLGYPGTLGASYIDYLIADPVLIPSEHRQYYDEKIAYLQHSYQPNDSTKEISEEPMTRNTLGLPQTGFVFCCFNSGFKITPDLFEIWMRLLKKVEGSVLWLLEGNPVAADNLRAESIRSGVDPERLIFAPRMDLDQHLARHRLADLFLDTFYYNAHTTASDALWAGLPVLTCPGETFASRVAASLLTAIDLPELIAENRASYESMALDLARDPHRLGSLRKRLAANRLSAPLFDTVRYTRDLENVYLAMYARQQTGLAPDHIMPMVDGYNHPKRMAE